MNSTRILSIVSGLKTKSTLKNQKEVGRAYFIKNEARPYYEIKLWSMGGQIYYLCPKFEKPGEYTLFSQMNIKPDESFTFSKPIGEGSLLKELQSHMELRLNFPRHLLFINLYPIKN